MILAIVRHGQTSYNAGGLVQGRINIPLNETGRKQARELGQTLKLKDEHFDLIASSPLSRALETASIIAFELGMNQPIYVDHHFVERDFASLDGTAVETAMPLVRIKNYQFEGYEHDAMMVNRIHRAVLNFYQIHGDKRVLLVAHSHVIKALMIHTNPEKYTFADLIRHVEIVYFEITQNHMRVLETK